MEWPFNNLNKKTCCVVGMGYIGTPTAALVANSGYQVLGVDINKRIVDQINLGKANIVEPKLDVLIKNVVKSKKLFASLKPSPASVFIIAVPTPFYSSEDDIPEPNIEFVLDAAKSISSVLRKGNLVLLESTCPVGTTLKVHQQLIKYSNLKKEDIYLAYCPERVIPGKTIDELLNNDRVIGGINSESSEMAKNFYKTFCKGQLFTTNSSTAEFVKLSENSFRDLNIAFANELSMITAKNGVDAREVIKLANFHPRVNILQPGCGVGGHCIAVDPWFIAHSNPSETPLIQTARRVNDFKSKWVINEIMKESEILKVKLNRRPLICCMGLTFKPDIDDTRQSPALSIVIGLIENGLNVIACEPNLDYHPKINLCSLDRVNENIDLVVFLVAHKQFQDLNLPSKKTLDYCGILFKN